MADEKLLEDPSEEAVLAAAEENFSEHILFLQVLKEEFREQAEAGKLPKQTELRETIRELVKSANVLQIERAKIAERRRKSSGAAGAYALDFAAAREEIGRRLDRLADAGKAG